MKPKPYSTATPQEIPATNLKMAMPPRTINSLKLEVCGAFGLTQEDLEGPSRSKTVTLARKIFSARATNEAGASLAEIGRALGGRGHTVIMYYLESLRCLYPGDPKKAGPL